MTRGLPSTSGRSSDAWPNIAPATGKAFVRLRNALAERIMPPAPVVLFFLSILLPIEFNLGGMFMTSTRLVLLVTTIPSFLMLTSGRLGPILATDVLFLIFAIWNIIILFYNNPDQAIAYGGSIALEVFGGYMLGRAYIRSPEDFMRTCVVFLWVIVLTLPFALYESQTGTAPIPTLISKIPLLYSVDDFSIEVEGIRLGLERSQVVFPHPILYGLFCSTALALAFVGMKRIVSNTARLAFCAAVILGVFLSLSSGAILPTILQVGLIFWAWMLKSVRSRWIILGILTAIAYVTVDMLSNRTPITVFLSYATFSPETAYGRILIFEWGMENVWAHPFWGLGLNDWARPWWKSGSMDNFWLVIAVQYGIPGFLILSAGFAMAFFRVMFRKLDSDPIMWQFRRAWVITFTSLILSLCTVHVWSTAQSFVFFLFGAGVWLLWVPPTTGEAIDAGAQSGGNGQRSGRIYSRFEPKVEPRRGSAPSEPRPEGQLDPSPELPDPRQAGGQQDHDRTVPHIAPYRRPRPQKG